MLKYNDKFNTKAQEKVVEVQTWEDLFFLTIDITKTETHCSTLAFFKEIVEPFNIEKGYGIAKFLPIPTTNSEQSYEIIAYFFDILSDPNIDLKEGKTWNYIKTLYGKDADIDFMENMQSYKQFDINKFKVYCIIFTDYNYKSSIEANDQRTTDLSEIHSLNHGVVVDIK